MLNHKINIFNLSPFPQPSINISLKLILALTLLFEKLLNIPFNFTIKFFNRNNRLHIIPLINIRISPLPRRNKTLQRHSSRTISDHKHRRSSSLHNTINQTLHNYSSSQVSLRNVSNQNLIKLSLFLKIILLLVLKFFLSFKFSHLIIVI